MAFIDGDGMEYMIFLRTKLGLKYKQSAFLFIVRMGEEKSRSR